MNEKKKMAYQITLILMALYFSLMETLIPKPIPLKLGLANISTILAIEKLGTRAGLEVLILRILVQSFMTSTMFTVNFFISFLSGLGSCLVMILLFKLKKFSTPAISCFSAVIHNVFQLFVVYFLLFRNIEIFRKETLLFVIFFMILGSFSGLLTGIIAKKFTLNIKEI